MSMTPTEILHDALQQCIDATEKSEYNVSFEYLPYVDAYSIYAQRKGLKTIAWFEYVVRLNEEDHQITMRGLKEFLELNSCYMNNEREKQNANTR